MKQVLKDMISHATYVQPIRDTHVIYDTEKKEFHIPKFYSFVDAYKHPFEHRTGTCGLLTQLFARDIKSTFPDARVFRVTEKSRTAYGTNTHCYLLVGEHSKFPESAKLEKEADLKELVNEGHYIVDPSSHRVTKRKPKLQVAGGEATHFLYTDHAILQPDCGLHIGHHKGTSVYLYHDESQHRLRARWNERYYEFFELAFHVDDPLKSTLEQLSRLQVTRGPPPASAQFVSFNCYGTGFELTQDISRIKRSREL